MLRPFLAVAALIAVPAAALAQPGAGGRWEGALTCAGQSGLPLVLEIDAAEPRALVARLDYGTGEGRGIVTFRGRVDSAGRIVLQGAQWERQPEGQRTISLEARLQTAGRNDPAGNELAGRVQGCGRGGFRATRVSSEVPDLGQARSGTGEDRRPPDRAAPPAPTAAPATARPAPQSAEDWIAGIRARSAELAARDDLTVEERNAFLTEIRHRAPRSVGSETRRMLEAEFREARESRPADALIAEIGAVPDRLEDGMARLRGLVSRSRYSGWSEPTRDRVLAAARDRAAAILTPELDATAALAPGLPEILAGLEAGHAALAPLVAHRGFMEDAFGRRLDPGNRLSPLTRRLGQIERVPAAQEDLRAALAAAARDEGAAGVGAAARRYLGSPPHR